MTDLPDTDQSDPDLPDTDQTSPDLPETDRPGSGTAPPAEGDEGRALDRAAAAIDEARDAAGSVAAHGDITSADDERAGEDSEDPRAEGGHP